MLLVFISKLFVMANFVLILFLISFVSFHPWLADLAAPVGSQEVVDHTHKW